MSASTLTSGLVFPHPLPPEAGEMVDIAPGIRWLRLALPFALNHVNIYLIDDGDGWAVLDTGVADLRTRTVWMDVITNRLGGRKLTRLILTHFHPDHLGLAGWMTGELGLELWMTTGEYRAGQRARQLLNEDGRRVHRGFFTRHGMDEATIQAAMGRGTAYMKMTTGLPDHYNPLVAGQTLRIGGRDFEILTGGGHAPEQAMLLCRADGIFLAADQVLARISPNIGVWPTEPESNPLLHYLTSLAALRESIPDAVLALPAHNLPFFGVHTRIGELQSHHDARCNEIIAACATPRTTCEVLPVLFPRLLDAHQIGFAFGEVLAHLNYLNGTGALISASEAGVVRFARD